MLFIDNKNTEEMKGDFFKLVILPLKTSHFLFQNIIHLT